MPKTDVTRRRMIAAGAGFVGAKAMPAQNAAAVLTAGEVIDRIKKNVGIPWMAQTVDNLIAGSPDTPVKGIATTMMATLDVMQRASAAGRNMVITHESTFYSHQDTLDQLKDDATYLYKTDFIRNKGMASFHFHDHWHRRSPDGIAFGMARALGWDTMLPSSSCGTKLSAGAIGHTGFTGTSLWIDPSNDLYVVILTNRVHPTRDGEGIKDARRAVHDAIFSS